MDYPKITCPLCGHEAMLQGTEDWFDIVRCDNCFVFRIHSSVNTDYSKEKTNIRKRYSMIYEFLSNHSYYEMGGQNYFYKFWHKYQGEATENDNPIVVDVSKLIKNYPKNVGEKLDRILLNIARKFPLIGEIFEFTKLPPAMLFLETPLCKIEKCVVPNKEVLPKVVLPNDPDAEAITMSNRERNTLLEYLCNIGYLQKSTLAEMNKTLHKLTAKAWERIGELTHRQREINQGFIAMKFPNDKDSDVVKQDLALISEGFKEAINACGYAPRLMLDIEHNNQIVPEIFFEIEQSKFTVVDVTYPNYGAYYEAGYAQALGKQVIICCRKGSAPPHFDISQKNMIFWTDKPDLIERLIKRIQATAGKNI